MSTASEDGEFQMSKEELDKFHKAMQSEEFRKLLGEYAEEISNPENKKKYEEEITQMEKERGTDVKFVKPEDGFVVKTTRQNDGAKAFVNICQNEHINKATFEESEMEEDGKRKKGQQWSIPFSLSQPREDFDNAGKGCVVFDAVFNPDTYKKGQQDPRFKELLIKTAVDGIEKQLSVKLNKKNLKFPKLKFKGMKQATVIRTKSEQQLSKEPDNTIGGETFPYPYRTPQPSNKSTKTKSKRHKKKKGKNKNLPAYYRENSSGNSSGNDNSSEAENSNNGGPSNNAKHPNQPVYRIVHRGVIDFQNFTNARDSCSSTRPKELIVSIELPLLKSTGTVELDIFEKQLLLTNQEPPYHLDLALPYPIDESNGHAKFDKSKKELIITLPVLQSATPPHPHIGITASEPSNEVQEEKETDNNQGTKTDDRNSTSTISNGFASQEELNGVCKPSELCQEEEKDVCESVLTSLSLSSNELNLEKKGLSNGDHHDDDDDDDDNHHDNESKLQAGGFVNADGIIGNTDMAWDHGDLDLPTSPKEQDLHFDLPSNLSEMSSPFFFKAPPFSFHQDADSVTFVIRIPNVAMENVSLGFNENKCYINFPSENTKPHHLPPPDYALYITFNAGQNLAPDLCHIDVNTDNVVLTLTKDDACKELWDSFKVGPGEELLEEKFFNTDKNVEVMMQEIADQDPWVTTSQSKFEEDLKITSASNDHLKIELKHKLVEAESGNVVISENHVAAKHKQTNRNKGTKSNEKIAMDPSLFKNLDIGEGILSNKIRHLKMSSPDEGIDCDFFSHERREKYSMGMSERIAASTDPKLVQEHGHKANLDEKRKSRSDSVDSTSSDRSDGDLTIANAVSRRKSCIRRSSSTSTDDSVGDDFDFDFNGPLSPNGTSWGSPGKKNVRFNLNPNVRVFSKKKDKQRWKMEQRLKNKKMTASNGDDKSNNIERLNAEPIAEEAHPVEDIVEDGNTSKATDGKEEQEDKNSNHETSVDDGWTLVEKPPAEPTLENSLIFELDE